MTTALTATLGYTAWRRADQSLTAHTAASRTIRAGADLMKVGAALAIVAAALGFAASDLAAPPIPAGHAIVMPAPHRPTVPGHRTPPVLQLPITANG